MIGFMANMSAIFTSTELSCDPFFTPATLGWWERNWRHVVYWTVSALLLITAIVVTIASFGSLGKKAGLGVLAAKKSLGAALFGAVNAGAKVAVSGLIMGGAMGALGAWANESDMWDGAVRGALRGAVFGFVMGFSRSLIAWAVAPATSVVAVTVAPANVPLWFNPDGTPNWPANNGFRGTPHTKVLKQGTQLGRFGDFRGKFVAPIDTPFDRLSMPISHKKLPYSTLVVNQPVTVLTGKAAPWFGFRGGGIQFLFSDSIQNLIDLGVLLPL